MSVPMPRRRRRYRRGTAGFVRACPTRDESESVSCSPLRIKLGRSLRSAGCSGAQPAGRRRAKFVEPRFELPVRQRLLERVELRIGGWHEQARQEKTQRLTADDRDG